MMTFSRTTLRLWICLIVGLSPAAARAQQQVAAGFVPNRTAVGTSVQYQVQIRGAESQGGTAPTFSLPGLKFRYMGPNSSVQMKAENGRFTRESILTFIYDVEAAQAGSYTMPATRFDFDGKVYETVPVTLKVDGQEQFHFLEIRILKQSAYVGETLPVEFRLHVDAERRWEPEAMPEFSSEGFIKQKFPEARKESTRKDGREYDVLVFRTTITPTKAGKLSLGPVQIPFIAQVPRAQNNRRQRSLFDMFNDPMFAENQRIIARAEAIEVDVKPLPTQGRPPGFSGAVGQFTFQAEGTPKRVKVGDPVTMKLTVAGKGNFDRVETPVMTDSKGWRHYPPASHFKAEDEVNYKGEKTFDMAVIPEAVQTAMPQFEFVFFDPEKAQYVTLKSSPEPLTVEGAPAAPAPAAVPASPFAAPKDQVPEAPKAVTDILGLRYDFGLVVSSFDPLYRREPFWLAQLIPLGGLLLLLAIKFGRTEGSAKETNTLRREKTALLAKIRRGASEDAEWWGAAMRILQIQTALATGRVPESVDAAAVRSWQRADVDTAEVVEEIFNARAELLYAGGGTGPGSGVPAATRQRVLAVLEKFEKSHAKS